MRFRHTQSQNLILIYSKVRKSYKVISEFDFIFTVDHICSQSEVDLAQFQDISSETKIRVDHRRMLNFPSIPFTLYVFIISSIYLFIYLNVE